MAQLKIRDLAEFLRQAPRRRDLEQDWIRLVYDGTALHMSTADAPDWLRRRGMTTRSGPRAGHGQVSAGA
ncbi:hypothetical protein AB0D57_24780 [Streptomyces sp. NPDC048275]|uniref:hypothetical protein n=1 Tax=Streptomyces sp. NPDC048275 TaxID=3155629 RepID=UPI0033EDCFC5